MAAAWVYRAQPSASAVSSGHIMTPWRWHQLPLLIYIRRESPDSLPQVLRLKIDFLIK